MTTETKKYRAAVGKQVYFLKSDEQESVVQEAINWVSAQIEKNIQACPDIDVQRSAVLVAIQAAIELSKIRSSLEQDVLQAEALITQLGEQLPL